MRRLGIVGFILLLAGCTAPVTWTRRDGLSDSDQFKRDAYRCVQESRVPYQTGGGFYVGYGPGAAAGVAAGAATGAIVAGAVAQGQANRLLALCMEAAGYRPATEDELAMRDLALRGMLPSAFLGVNLSFANQEATVTRVVIGSPANAVGLTVGDRIVRIDGQLVPENNAAFLTLLSQKQPGYRLALEIQRGDQSLHLEPVLRAR